MALLKYGAIISEARGKINGVVLSRNQYGAYARAVGTLLDPETSYQLAQRANLVAASQAWRVLSEPQRAGWYAATRQHMRTNIFGDAGNLSGFNYFVKLYLRATLIGVTLPALPPINTPATSPTNISPRVLNDEPSFSWNVIPQQIPAGETGILEAAINVSQGRTFVKNRWRFICTLAEANYWTENLAAVVEARLGTITPYTRACIRIRHIHNASLQSSTRIHATGVVGEA